MSIWPVFDSAASDIISGAILAIGAAALTVARRRWVKVRKRKASSAPLINEVNTTPKVEALRLRRQQDLEVKLNTISLSATPRLHLIGGLYLDLMLRPIGTEALSGEEWSNLDPVNLQLGGSCYWLGRYLSEIYQESSHLHSFIGSGNDALTQEANRLIGEEKWILNRIPSGNRGTQTAVSIHLIQRSNEYTTIFTHRGALAEFTWQDVEIDVNDPSINPSILHISGFMKTNLASGLISFLRVAHQTNVIVFDHGGLVSHAENPNSIHTINEAFGQGLVDIYVCSYRDFIRFPSVSDAKPSTFDVRDVKRTLEILGSSRPLPIYTIVRGDDLPDRSKAYVITGNSVAEVSLQDTETISNGYFFSKLMFDAGFLHSLSHNDSNSPIESRVVTAASTGLGAWSKRSNIGLP